MDKDPRKGFITLLSSQDYLEGVIVLYKSLQRVNTKYNFINCNNYWNHIV